MNPYSAEYPVKIFTTPLCGYCVMAKRLLMSRGVHFEEDNVAGQSEARAWLLKVSGQRTVPQIFIHGQSIGGYTELSALDRAGKLIGMVHPDSQ
ncbi:MAG: glutaredoxin [Myxococcales bacterium]|nr:glutaredoxin [Myxococcales bacterium]